MTKLIEAQLLDQEAVIKKVAEDGRELKQDCDRYLQERSECS